MLRLCQRADRWKNVKIGKSESTIGTNGCLITSLCMELSKLFPERGFSHFYTPEEAAKNWTYVTQGEDHDPRYLDYIKSKEAFKNAGFEFVWRNYSCLPERAMKDPITGEYLLESIILKKYLNSKNYGICFRVKTKSGGQHWVAGSGASWLGSWVAYDPWSGDVAWKLSGFSGRYPEIDGWCLIRKIENSQ